MTKSMGIFTKPTNDTPTPAMSRGQLEQMRELRLAAIALEDDPEKLEEGIIKIADLNASIRRCKDIEQARGEVYAARKLAKIESAKRAQISVNEFEQNINHITVMACSRDPLLNLKREAGGTRTEYIHKRHYEYFQQLSKQLSFEQAQTQVDEILNADLQRRDWKDVVGLPPIPKTGVSTSTWRTDNNL